MKKYWILGMLFACSSSPRNTIPPEQAAEKFVTDLKINAQGKPSCTGVDTDNDGYVTCTVALAGGDAPKFMSIQCAAQVTSDGCSARYTTGCKETEPKLVQVSQ